MKFTPITSSNISGVHYEGTTLYIQFVKGYVYEYLNVPETIHKGILAAESAGKYFHENIRHNFTGTPVK